MRSRCAARTAACFLELSFLLALVAGVTATYAGWIAYGHYFARRARVDEITALQYDALSWSSLVLLWGTLLAPSAAGGTGRAAAFAAERVRAREARRGGALQPHGARRRR